MLNAFKNHWRLYFSEALGLSIFMISACFFGAMLEGETIWHRGIPSAFSRTVITGVLMGATALFIFYAPFTKASGAYINPAVAITFLRLGKIGKWDALFYIIFQIVGGTIAVYLMAHIIGKPLTSAPVNYIATVPFKGTPKAFITEFIIAFMMMIMVLSTSAHNRLKKFTRLFSSCFVCAYVIIAGPISGFGMNPARSLASAIPSNIWSSWWIYMLVPVVSMLLAAESFLFAQKLIGYRRREPKTIND
jgi:aquaporin Z